MIYCRQMSFISSGNENQICSDPLPLLSARRTARHHGSHAEDVLQAEGGLRKNGAYGLMRFAILGTLGLVGEEIADARRRPLTFRRAHGSR